MAADFHEHLPVPRTDRHDTVAFLNKRGNRKVERQPQRGIGISIFSIFLLILPRLSLPTAASSTIMPPVVDVRLEVSAAAK